MKSGEERGTRTGRMAGDADGGRGRGNGDGAGPDGRGGTGRLGRDPAAGGTGRLGRDFSAGKIGRDGREPATVKGRIGTEGRQGFCRVRINVARNRRI